MSKLTESLRLEAEDCLRKAEETANADLKTMLLMSAARLHGNAIRLETIERDTLFFE
jgi:hypothetical protein